MSMPSYPQGQYPYQGGGAPAAVKPKPPGTVTGALVIYVLAAAVAVISIIVLFNSTVWNEILSDAGVNSSVANTYKIGFIVAAVVFAALYLFFAFMMWGGRNWARIVLTVLSALSIANSVRYTGSVTVGDRTYTMSSNGQFSWIGVGLAVLAIILMYVGGSNAYFRASRAYRKGPQY